MKLKVQVEEYTFQIDVGQGWNDFAWLALVAAKLYTNKKNPNANFLPCYLQFKTIDTDFYLSPHPRTKIFDLMKEDDEPSLIKVDIRKGVVPPTQEQEKWYDQAYGKLRNLMTVEFQMLVQTAKINIRQDPICAVALNYKMFPEVNHEFNARDYKNIFEITMQSHDMGQIMKYTAEITLPLGDLTAQFVSYYKTDKTDDDNQRVRTVLDQKTVQYQIRKYPNPVSQADIQKKIVDRIKDQEQKLNEQLEQQEKEAMQEKKSDILCPYKFQKLWDIIQKNAEGNLTLDNLEDNLFENIYEIMEHSLPQLYDLFYQYTILYDQDPNKKDEIGISLQDLMHLLKFYGLVQDSSQLVQYIEFYDQKGIRLNNASSTLAPTVKFPEFMVMLIKLAQFKIASNLVEVQHQHILLEQSVTKAIELDADESRFNDFQGHMKYNLSLINFLRENQPRFQNLFSRVGVLTTKDTANYNMRYYLKREEIKQIIQDAGYKGEEIDSIVEACYQELFLDKYQGFEGIFFYEFLQVVQWLSLALIQQNETTDAEPIADLIEKLNYFLQNLEQ